jgi:hypothetical protein
MSLLDNVAGSSQLIKETVSNATKPKQKFGNKEKIQMTLDVMRSRRQPKNKKKGRRKKK